MPGLTRQKMLSWITGKDFTNRPGRPRFALCVAIFLAPISGRISAADASATPAPAAPIEAITALTQLNGLSPEMKLVAHSLRLEGRVSFYDPSWGNSWLEEDGVGRYLPLSKSPPALRSGQRVLIEGSLVPSKGLEAGAVTVKILQEYEPVVPPDITGRIHEVGPFSGRMVSLEGYVDGQQMQDYNHLRLALVVEGRPVIGWLKPDDPRSIPDWRGQFVRVAGLYSDRFDATATETTIEIWISRQSDLTVLGSLAGYPGFELPVTPIDKVFQVPDAQEVHVRGRLQSQEVGSFLVIRDNTGLLVVHSVQKQPLLLEAEVEAVGRVAISGAQWILQSALYRRVRSRIPPNHTADKSAALDSIDQIRRLTSEEAARGLPVTVSGTVVWVNPKTDFFFLQDVTGCLRVRYSREKIETPRLVQHLAVEGVTIDGGFAPAVELRRARDLGSMTASPPKPVTFDQAITGKEDGQWVEMRGFLQRTESDGDSRRICRPAGFAGEFQSHPRFIDSPSGRLRDCGVRQPDRRRSVVDPFSAQHFCRRRCPGGLLRSARAVDQKPGTAQLGA